MSLHIPLAILSLLAVGMATIPASGIADGLVHVVRHAARGTAEEAASCRQLLKAESTLGRWVSVILERGSPGISAVLGRAVR